MSRACTRFGLLLMGLLAAVVIACGDDDGSDPTPVTGAAPAEAPLTGKVTIFAAASLTDAFVEVIAEFRKLHPAVEVTSQFGGSASLRAQLEQGARADIFASADQPQMQIALRDGVVRDAVQTFARNSLVIVTPKDNPASVGAPIDLKKPGLKLVLAAPEVPAGSYARQALQKLEQDPVYGAGFSDAVLKNLVSNESNVRQVVAKVELGEADAGIVYGTDVTSSLASRLAVVQIPTPYNVIAEYPIALTAAPSNSRAAQALIDFILSADGQAILEKYGFQTIT